MVVRAPREMAGIQAPQIRCAGPAQFAP